MKRAAGHRSNPSPIYGPRHSRGHGDRSLQAYRGLHGMILGFFIFLSAAASAASASEFQLDEKKLHGITVLEGDWEYYPGELKDPASLPAVPRAGVRTMRVPFWETDSGKPKTATLRAFVRLPRAMTQYSLRSGLAYSASRIWVNGKLSAEIGAFSGTGSGRSTGNGFDPGTSWVEQEVFPLPAEKWLEIVIQVENTDQRFFGLYRPPSIGPTEALARAETSEALPDLIVLGITIGLFTYCFSAFLLNPRIPLNRWLLALGAAIVLKTFLRLPPGTVSRFMPFQDYQLLYSLNFLAYYLIALSTYFATMNAAPRLLAKAWLPVMTVSTAVLSARLFLLPTREFYGDIYVMHFLVLGIITNVMHSIFLSRKGALRLRRELRYGFSFLALLSVPAICLHAAGNDHAMAAENAVYMFFVLLFAFLKSKHQEDSYKRIRTEIRKRRHAYTQLVKMIYPHQLRMIKDGMELELTMPTGTHGQCAVICFDIMNSSELPSADAKHILAEVFAGCYQAMMRNYDRNRLNADAYRINEVGDGFYCSIGFPFQSSEDKRPESAAYLLAKSFIAVVDRITERRVLPSPLHCSIGIAIGELSGFFTLHGIKRYEMFGEAIILANRYEAMRKRLFPDASPQRHVLILQDKVASMLPVELKRTLTAVALDGSALSVRNDPGAKTLYYQLLSQDTAQGGPHRRAG